MQKITTWSKTFSSRPTINQIVLLMDEYKIPGHAEQYYHGFRNEHGGRVKFRLVEDLDNESNK